MESSLFYFDDDDYCIYLCYSVFKKEDLDYILQIKRFLDDKIGHVHPTEISDYFYEIFDKYSSQYFKYLEFKLNLIIYILCIFQSKKMLESGFNDTRRTSNY